MARRNNRSGFANYGGAQEGTSVKPGRRGVELCGIFGATAIALGAALLAPPVGQAAPASAAPTVGICTIFPANNVWNTPIDTLPVHARSDAWISSIGRNTGLHPDFGADDEDGNQIGIPYSTVTNAQPAVTITFDYDDESDPGPYRIPPDALIEGGSDNHVILINQDNCHLTEIFDANKQSNTVWTGGSGAIFDLNSNALRPDSWTSADAAGLPIFPGLVRYDEVAAGEITHALRFTAEHTQKAYLWPARHYASSSTNPNLPPMGARVRLKQDVDIAGYSPEAQVILRALKKYGMFLADNGSDWFITGAPDSRWDNDTLVSELRKVPGSSFEFVDASSLMVSPDSGEARTAGGTATVPAAPAAPRPPTGPAAVNHADAYLPDADFRGVDLRGADLRRAILTGANFDGADLTGADLDTATLTGATMRNAILIRANFREADVSDVDFTGATFGQTICNDGHVSDGPSC